MAEDDNGNPLGVLLERAKPDGGFASQQSLEMLQARLFGRSDPTKLVGRYRLEQRLGAGGGGTVYRARDPETGRVVAIKLLVADNRASSARARLIREAQSLAKLSHPNIVEFLEVGTFDPGVLEAHATGHEHGVFMAMEFVEGRNLAEWGAERHTFKEIRDTFVAAGRGLAFAHARGFVHRDFKPSNVLVGDDGRVRVADFGLARVTRELTAPVAVMASRFGGDVSLPGMHVSLTKPGTVLGTPAYMAPEQHLSSRADARSDQFSFCLALYETLYGRGPYVAGTAGKMLEAKLRGMIAPPPRDVKIPLHIHRAVVRGLQPDASLRHASMDDLLAILETEHDHSRTVRWIAAAGGLALATAGATAFALHRADDGGCSDALADSGWDSNAFDRLRTALTGSTAGFRETTLTRVGERLDTWSTVWSAARERVCDASSSGADVATQRACLRDAKAHVLAFVAAVPAGSGGTAMPGRLERAIATLDLLWDPSECVTAAAEAAPPALADEVARAEIAVALGDPAAPSLADALGDRGRELGDPMTIALAEGLGLRARGRFDDPTPWRTAHAALVALAAPRRAEELALAALTGAAELGDREAAATWVAAIDGDARSSTASVRARVFAAMAALAYARESYDEATAWCRSAHDVTAQSMPGSVSDAEVAMTCARVPVAAGRDAAAIAAWEAAAAATERAWGGDHPMTAFARAEFAFVLFMAGRRDAARPHAAIALDVLTRGTTDDDARRIAPLLLLGELDRSRDPEAAARHFAQAEAIASADERRALAQADGFFRLARGTVAIDPRRSEDLVTAASSRLARMGPAADGLRAAIVRWRDEHAAAPR